MWSSESACPPQYWQRASSRANSARRDIAVRRAYGTFTTYRRRTTEGLAIVMRAECTMWPSPATKSALSASTKHTARKAGTTDSGSYVAFNTSALLTDGNLATVCLLAAPFDVADDIVGHDCVIGAAVLSDHSKAQIVATWYWEKRPSAPPPTRCHSLPLTQSSGPQTWFARNRRADRSCQPQRRLWRRFQRGSLGSPNTISPMMLRCTCDEPA